MIKKFRKKPVVIQAVQWIETNYQECKIFCEGKLMADFHSRPEPIDLHVETLEGLLHVSPNDWIIKGIQSEFYPCKPDIFEATYEEISHETL